MYFSKPWFTPYISLGSDIVFITIVLFLLSKILENIKNVRLKKYFENYNFLSEDSLDFVMTDLLPTPFTI